MKKQTLALAAAAVASLTSCGSPSQGDVVKQKYVHKYGLEVPSEDWESRGKDGTVITTLANGVNVTNLYVRGSLHGESTYSFPHSDTIERIDHYDNGKLVKQTFNNENGWPREEIRFCANNQYEKTTWYESSSPQSVETYRGDRLITGQYYTAQHQLESRVDDGEGMRIVRDFYGTHLRNEQISAGVPALVLTYHPNQVLESETPYVNGKVEGVRQTFHPSGEPNTTESWIAGKQHGLTVEYKNGLVWKEIPYVDGHREGVEKVYRNGCDLVEEVTWFEGKKHGPHRRYIDEIVKTEWYYRDGLMPKGKKEQFMTHQERSQ